MKNSYKLTIHILILTLFFIYPNQTLLAETKENLVHSVKAENSIPLTLEAIEQEGIIAKLEYRKKMEDIVEKLKLLLNQTGDEVEKAKILYRIAQVEEKELNKENEAAERLKQCIENFPMNDYSANAYHKLADIYVKEGKYYDAIKLLDRCGQTYGDQEVGRDARLKMIYIFKDKLKDMDMAIDSYKNYIYLYPDSKDSARLCEELSDIYIERGDFENAKKYIDKISELFPNGSEIQKSKLKLASMYRGMRDYQKEADALEEFYTKYPKNPEAPKMAYMVGEIYEKNLIKYRKKMGYINPKTRKRENVYKLVRGSYRKAISKFEEVSKRFPNSPYARRAMIKMAEIYDKKLYEQYKAKEVLEKLVNSYPNSKEGKMAKELLRTKYN